MHPLVIIVGCLYLLAFLFMAIIGDAAYPKQVRMLSWCTLISATVLLTVFVYTEVFVRSLM